MFVVFLKVADFNMIESLLQSTSVVLYKHVV